MKICNMCGKEKSITEFSIDKTKLDGLSSRCKQCQRKLSNEHYKKNKQKYKIQHTKRRYAMRLWLSSIKETTGCAYCGETESSCIEPHHPHEKKETVSRIFSDYLSETKIINELLKCIPLCANCHRKYHSGSGKDTEQIRKIVDSIKLPYDWKISEFKFP